MENFYKMEQEREGDCRLSTGQQRLWEESSFYPSVSPPVPPLRQGRHPCAHARERAGWCAPRRPAYGLVRRRGVGGRGLLRLRPGAWRECSDAARARARILGGRYSGRSRRC